MRQLIRLLAGVSLAMLLALIHGFAADVVVASVPRMPSGDWVDSVAHMSDPSELFGTIARQPTAARRQVFRKLPSRMRGEMWKIQIAKFRASRPGLSPQQISFLDNVTREFEPEAYEDPGRSHRIRAACETAAALFSVEDRAWLGTLGAPDQPPGFLKTQYLSIVAFARDSLVLNARQIPDCNCSRGSWCSCWQCLGGGICRSQDGCGCFWDYECDGCCGGCEL